MININLLYRLSITVLLAALLIKMFPKVIKCRYPVGIDYLFLIGMLIIEVLFQNPEDTLAFILFCSLFWVSLTDIFYRMLPNTVNFSLLGLGLILSTQGQFISIVQSILGVVFGYGVLWVVSCLYWHIVKQPGIGKGDLKLTSALGAWIGFDEIPCLLLLSSLLGCLFYWAMAYLGKYTRTSKIPLGVFLSITGMGIFTLRFSSWRLLLG